MIDVKNLEIRFKDRVLLKEVSLHVNNKEALGIIGPSGSGKSVFLKTLAGLIAPAQGTISMGSEKISMLFQKNALFDSLTLLQNLLLPLSETLKIEGEDAMTRSMEMLKAVGLESSANLFPDEISGGMQKRLGIARALIIEPEVLLYDEPTAGLDPITSKSIAELMISLHRKNGTTLVMVTNDLERAYQVSDQIAFCDAQTITVMGTPSEVKKTHHERLKRFIYSSALSSKSVGAP